MEHSDNAPCSPSNPRPHTCGSCFYWKRNGNERKPGVCKRFPRYENKTHSQWCGEYREDATRYSRA